MTRDDHMDPIENSAVPGEPAAPAPSGSEQRPPRLVSRRALVRAGWTVPVVLALHLPVNAWAFTPAPAPPPHSDAAATAHSDTAATAHSDVAANAAVNTTVLGVHTDTPATLHTDVPATLHADVPATLHSDA
jgi:hypothetical protein